MNDTCLILDIGNSRIKIKYKNNFYSYKSYEIENKLSELIANEIENLIAIISSVNDDNKNVVRKVLKKKRVKYIFVDELFSNQNIIDFGEIENMGTDRKLGLLGAIKNYSVPLLTVDCGTATTINVLDENYRCLGGNIFAGFHTHSKSLNLLTSKLPYVKTFPQRSIYIGKNTWDAISNGVMAATIGGISITIKSIIEKNHWTYPRIIITGGVGDIILDFLNDKNIKSMFGIENIDLILDKHLVTSGIEFLYNKCKNNC